MSNQYSGLGIALSLDISKDQSEVTSYDSNVILLRRNGDYFSSNDVEYVSIHLPILSQDCPDCEDSQFCHSSRVSHPQLHLGIRYPNLID
ncbi:hypothetical protein Tco_1317243 [Tanacetum coccineum]